MFECCWAQRERHWATRSELRPIFPKLNCTPNHKLPIAMSTQRPTDTNLTPSMDGSQFGMFVTARLHTSAQGGRRTVRQKVARRHDTTGLENFPAPDRARCLTRCSCHSVDFPFPLIRLSVWCRQFLWLGDLPSAKVGKTRATGGKGSSRKDLWCRPVAAAGEVCDLSGKSA